MAINRVQAIEEVLDSVMTEADTKEYGTVLVITEPLDDIALQIKNSLMRSVTNPDDLRVLPVESVILIANNTRACVKNHRGQWLFTDMGAGQAAADSQWIIHWHRQATIIHIGGSN